MRNEHDSSAAPVDLETLSTVDIGKMPTTIVERDGDEAAYLAHLYWEHQKAYPGYVSKFKIRHWTDGETCSLVRQVRMVRPAALAFEGIVVWLEQPKPNGTIELFTITRSQWAWWMTLRASREVGR